MAPTAREIAGDKYILWGASWSLYTAKVRPYLIKKGVEYVEINPSHPHYNDTIIKTVGYFTVPVLETRPTSFLPRRRGTPPVHRSGPRPLVPPKALPG